MDSKTRQILNLFSKTNKEILSGRYMLDNTTLSTHLYTFVDKGVLVVNPGLDEESINEYYNDYELSKYYKRLVTLEKIEDEL